ncbi:uncharacterized protein DS421_10g298500 [Arachis hypogaea]|nr:uncharacterized protein DS421_10g298500 [Arachis hypogaea]
MESTVEKRTTQGRGGRAAAPAVNRDQRKKRVMQEEQRVVLMPLRPLPPPSRSPRSPHCQLRKENHGGASFLLLGGGKPMKGENAIEWRKMPLSCFSVTGGGARIAG